MCTCVRVCVCVRARMCVCVSVCVNETMAVTRMYTHDTLPIDQDVGIA